MGIESTPAKSKKILNLLSAGLDSNLAEKAINEGYTLTRLKSGSKSELGKSFSGEEVEKLLNLRRKPIPKDIVEKLVEKCHWKCCLCWEYGELKPVIIHHIVEHSKTQDDSYENLVVLCLNHHAEAHSKWEISRHPLPPELIRSKKWQWEVALSDFVAGKRPPPTSHSNLVTKEARYSTEDLLAYAKSIADKYSNWHIPDELASLIDWEVNPVPIDDYVNLKKISEETLFPYPSIGVSGRKTSELKTTLQEALNNNKVLIVGNAGTGKSTCLRYICHHYASTTIHSISRNRPYPNLGTTIPILVSLRHFGKNDLSSLLNSQLRSHKILADNNLVHEILNNSKCILLLDGLDEVQSKWREDLVNEIEVYSQSFPNIQIVITSRKQPQPELLSGFVCYEIEALKDESVLRFAEAYLGFYHRYAFMHFIEQNRLEEIIQTPLFLTFCLILFRQNAGTLTSLTDVYFHVLQLYKKGWEDIKKGKSSSIDWMILERALAVLAYHMEVNRLENSVTREQVIQVLSKEVKLLQEEHLWSSTQTILDLISQLLFHNLLVSSDEVFGFWHTSFQDFFAARQLSKLPIEITLELADTVLNFQTLAFLGAMITDSSPIISYLVEKIQNTSELSRAVLAVETLGSMGSKFTYDIIRAIAKPNYYEVHMAAKEVLEFRDFEGKSIFQSAFNLLMTIEQVFRGDIDQDDLDSFPEPDRINFNIFISLYTKTLLAVSQGHITTAKKHNEELHVYIASLVEEEKRLDEWLISCDLTDLYIFASSLRERKITSEALFEFCRNTLLHSSLPFLEKIVDFSQDYRLRLEASNAIQCIIRR
ncbi:MAG TPA: NACHT domain-containing protein [Chloroflexota bacterium]|nr:NACHT domain-containing protein [Chloroflexota bacterium]HUM68901.1 NACHT domain-containing protein [Chloroflexota bacterium]